MNVLQYRPNKEELLKRNNASLNWFLSQDLTGKRVLEIGTKRAIANIPTAHIALFPDFRRYTTTDIEPCIDVDVVCDAHDLSKVLGENQFDIVWCSSVFEHLRAPWIVAEEILKVLAPGGVFFVQTHQSFCLHGYPHDYFRFSKEALESLFSRAFKTVSSYDFPCKIIPQDSDIDWNNSAECYLNVNIAGMK